MKTWERERARSLRRVHGRSIREIAIELGVSRSSASRWVRDIQLTPSQRATLAKHNRGDRVGTAVRKRAVALERRKRWQAEGRARARAGGARHMAGCMLFWAEGSRSRDSVCFTNSDPAMMRFFLRFLVSDMGVELTAVRLDLNLFADHAEAQSVIERFWLETLGLPGECMRKSTVNTFSRHSARKRLNKLPYGTCRISVHSTELVQHVYGAIQEYGGFERPEWLD